MSGRSAFRYGEVRRFLLEAIAEHPRHGYDLIRVIAERVGPDYRLRRGTVYPCLAKLADDGLITGTRTGRRVVYTITERGQQQVTAPTATTDRGSEDRETLLGRDSDLLEAVQRAVTDFARDVNDDIAAHATRVELSPEAARRLAVELARAREAIARLLAGE